jgi:hypothetical protein
MTAGANSDREAIRVAVVVESFMVPEWVAWTVARIDAMSSFVLATIAVDGERPAARTQRALRAWIFRLYGWVDRKVFGAADAMHDADLSPLARDRSTSSEPLDVVVSFLPAHRTTWNGPAPRHGVWAIVPMDDGLPASAPTRFWELRKGDRTAACVVVAVEHGSTRVIARDAARADPLSLTRTRNAAAWTSARLLLRCLRSLSPQGGPAEARNGPGPEPCAIPPPTLTVRHAARTAVRGLAAKSRSALQRDEWFVAVRRRSPYGGAHESLRILPNPAGRYLGDPFPIEVDGRHFVFVEDYSRATGRGSISVSEAGPGDSWSPPRKVLESDHHLSYPFVFRHDGAIYMLPETGEAGRIELHRAVAFPDEWRLERVLLDGLTAVDATLHVDDGVFWLFANVVEGREDRGQLCLFSSRSLDGEWRPHPRNPIVTDPGRARPAGRIFTRAGAHIRPSQDCARRYGEAIVLNRVDVLSPTEYRETPVGRIEPDWLAGLEGTHTYTFDSRYEFLDGYRHVARVQRPALRVR